MQKEIYSEEFCRIVNQQMPSGLKWGWLLVIGIFIAIGAWWCMMPYQKVKVWELELHKDSGRDSYSSILVLATKDAKLFREGQAIEVNLLDVPGKTLIGQVSMIHFDESIRQSIIEMIFSTQELLQNDLKGEYRVVTGKEKMIVQLFPILRK